MSPTPFPALDDVLARLTDGVRDALPSSFLGLYLQGSFAVGDADEHSDVDFVVVTEAPLSGGEVARLQTMHAGLFDPTCGRAQYLEGSYFPRDVLRDWQRRGEALWYLDNGSSSLVRESHCNTAVVRETVRRFGVRLAGPDPTALVDPVPPDVLRDEMLGTIRDWGAEILSRPDDYANRFYQGFITLNYCRMWCDSETGTLGSKRRGAEWAKARLDPSWTDLIDRAWATRPHPEITSREPADPDDFARTLELVRLVIGACDTGV